MLMKSKKKNIKNEVLTKNKIKNLKKIKLMLEDRTIIILFILMKKVIRLLQKVLFKILLINQIKIKSNNLNKRFLTKMKF